MAERAARAGVPAEGSDGPGGERQRVIYVMGAGHSGSTILGVALGNCEGIFYAGEVEEWLSKRGHSPIGGSERVNFWAEVSSHVSGAERLFDAEVHRSLERSSAILRPSAWRARRRLREDYRRVALEVFRAIAKTAGADTVVDSSHFPLRARELQSLAELELYLVFLVREPEEVVSSELRGIHRHNVAERRVRLLQTNANLWLTNLLSVVVFSRHPRNRRLFVRHEEFLADPEGTLRQILALTGSAADVPDLTELRTGFPLLGNKLIHSERVSLRRAGGPPPRPSVLTRVLQAPWKPVLARMAPHAGAAAAGDTSEHQRAPTGAR